MPKGVPFPDVGKLTRAMVDLQWNRERLAQETGISSGTIGKLLDGRPVDFETCARVAVTVADAWREQCDPGMRAFREMAV